MSFVLCKHFDVILYSKGEMLCNANTIDSSRMFHLRASHMFVMQRSMTQIS